MPSPAPEDATSSRASRPLHVAISLGNADVAPAAGVTPADITAIHLDLASRLLERGHVLVYGGDLKPTGLSGQLVELACTHTTDPEAVREHPERRLRNGVAWPIWLQYDDAQLGKHRLAKVFERYDAPDELELDDDQKATFVKPDTSEHRLWWSRSLSAMREQLDRTTDARVVVCGRGIGSSGAIPGILEEALVAVRHGTPLFLVGGFGGVAVPLIEALTTGRTKVFRRDVQVAHPPMKDFYAYLDSIGRQELADFDGIVRTLHEAGIAGLHNGLTEAENRTLFTSTDWPAVAALVLEGLARLPSRHRG